MSLLDGRISAVQRVLAAMTDEQQVMQFMQAHRGDAVTLSMADQRLKEIRSAKTPPPPQATVADQMLGQGVAALNPGTAVPEQGYANGGIVAFAAGDKVEEKMTRQQKFARENQAAAERAARQLGVDPGIIIAHWGHESGWGSKPVGSFNYGNIKDFSKSGSGTRGYDKEEKSNDRYRNYKSAEEFADDYVAQIKKNWPEAVGAGGDSKKFLSGLENGRLGKYATDENYKDKMRGVIAQAHKFMPVGTAAANEAQPKEAPKTADKKDDATFGFWDARNVAPILDTFVSPISGAARLGTYLGGRFQGMSPDEASENARRITQETIPVDRPFGRALGITETPEYKNEPTQQLTNWIGGGIGNLTKKASDVTGASDKFDQRDIDAARDVALLGVGRLAQGVPKGRAPNVPRAATAAEAEASQAAKAAAARAAAEAEARVSATRLPAPSTASQPRLPAPNKATLVVDEAGNVVQGPAVQGAGAAGQAADAAAQAAATQRGLAGLAADQAAAKAARATAEGIQTLAKPLTAAEKAGRGAATAVRAAAPVVTQGVKLNAFGNAEPSEDGEGGMDYPDTEYQSGPHPRNVPVEMAPEALPEVPVEDRTGVDVEKPKSRFTDDDWLMAGLATLQEAGKSGANWATSIGAGGIEGLKNRRTRASDEAKQALEQAQMDLYRNQGKWYGSREDIERSKLEAKAEGADAALRKVALQQATQLLNKEMADPTSMLNRMGLSGPELEAMRQRRLLELSGLAYQQLGGSTTMPQAGATVPGMTTGWGQMTTR